MDDAQRRLHAASFGAAADVYERSRPNYPDAAVDWLLPPSARRVLDLGAGTGKLTCAFVARGLDTVAVDPSEPMLDQLRRKLPNVDIHQGTAEAIPVGDASVDTVLVAQAWHWVDPARAVPEAARVLVPDGTLGLLWNIRDDKVPWVARLNAAIDQGVPALSESDPDLSDRFGPVERAVFAWDYEIATAALIDLVMSRSIFLMMEEDERHVVLGRVKTVLNDISIPQRTGMITIPYVTRCYRAVKRRA